MASPMLTPYRVLDLGGNRDPFAGFLFALHGADVILVEPPGASPSTPAYNRGKRSVTLDLDDPADRTRFEHLVAGADVLVEGWTPAERALPARSIAHLAALNPALVHASITPFGLDGPHAGWEATDLTVMASASPLSVTGDRDRPPVRITVPQAFLFAGATAASAIQIALLERASSGTGQHIDVSAQTAAAIATQTGILAAGVGAPASVRSAGGASMGRMSLRFLYPAKDGHVSITHVFGEVGGPATARLMAWAHERGFCDAETAGKDWIRYAVLVDSGEETLESWEAVKDTVARFTSSLTKAELLAGAIERNLLMAPVADVADVLASEHFAMRGFFDPLVVEPGTAPVPVPGAYARYSAWESTPLAPPPAPGADTDAVLAEPRRPAVTKAADAEAAGSPARGRGAGALAGLKVLDLTWSVAGPAMIRVVADHGADVIKVESIRRLDGARTFIPFHGNVAGVENSAMFDNWNAGKRSVSLKLSEPAARVVLEDLIRWADVVIDSLSPRGRTSLGLGFDRLRALNPQIIAVSTSLFGLDGPLAELAGYGNLGAALTGFYELTGWPDRSPAGPYLAYTDYTSANLLAVSVLAAVDHRRRTGEGQFVELSQSETAVHFLTPALLDASMHGAHPTRMGNDDAEMAPHGVYPADGDDLWVAIACQDDARWLGLCDVIARPDLAADTSLADAAGRRAERRRLDEAVSAWTAALPAAEAARRCQERGIAAYEVQTSAACLADPQLQARGHFVQLDHPDRLCLVEATRFRMSRTPGAPQRRAPFLGEHTFEVLSEVLGYDEDRIAELAAAEVLE